MAAGGFCKLPDGRMVVALTLPRPVGRPASGAVRTGADGTVRVLVHAVNRARALTRLRNLGLRAVYLSGNAEPPTEDEITAVLHHPDGLIWRASTGGAAELWHPIRALLPAPRYWPGAEAANGLRAADLAPAGPAPGGRKPGALPPSWPQTTGFPDSSTPASRIS